jgi:peptidoglycan hydrolase-like protein with peptidoglycan-binding domain
MSSNRLSWIGVGVVVVVVAILVARTVRQDEALTPAGSAPVAAQRDPAAQRPVASERTERAPSVPSSIQRAKQVLKDKGYYDGPVDGNFDPTVSEALKKFQKDAGMTPTGNLDAKTYAALGVEVKSRRARP